MTIKLKSRVRDTLTGFEGFATARCEYMNGCIQYEIVPAELKDGRPQKAIWLDEQQLQVVKVKKRAKKAKKTPLRSAWGGPQNSPSRDTPPSSYGEDDDNA